MRTFQLVLWDLEEGIVLNLPRKIGRIRLFLRRRNQNRCGHNLADCHLQCSFCQSLGFHLVQLVSSSTCSILLDLLRRVDGGAFQTSHIPHRRFCQFYCSSIHVQFLLVRVMIFTFFKT